MTAAFISAGAAILICLFNNWLTDRRRKEEADDNLKIFKAEISADIKALTRSVEKHNNVIERVYQLETRADVFDEKMKVANHRINDLEEKAL